MKQIKIVIIILYLILQIGGAQINNLLGQHQSQQNRQNFNEPQDQQLFQGGQGNNLEQQLNNARGNVIDVRKQDHGGSQEGEQINQRKPQGGKREQPYEGKEGQKGGNARHQRGQQGQQGGQRIPQEGEKIQYQRQQQGSQEKKQGAQGGQERSGQGGQEGGQGRKQGN
ncbi:hypothetical protein ABPG72_021246 [Tetrahymena utriculariae]